MQLEYKEPPIPAPRRLTEETIKSLFMKFAEPIGNNNENASSLSSSESGSSTGRRSGGSSRA